jgi:hypothetical protein
MSENPGAKTIDLPLGSIFDTYVEEVPHKATVYEQPRVMIFFEGPCDVEMSREGNKVVMKGVSPDDGPHLAG